MGNSLVSRMPPVRKNIKPKLTPGSILVASLNLKAKAHSVLASSVDAARYVRAFLRLPTW